MNKKLIILLIAVVSAVICISPMAAAENNAFSDVVLLDFNLFGGDDSLPFEIENLKILKVNKKHTKSNGNVKKGTDYYLKFNVKSEDSFDYHIIKIDCLDKKNKTIKEINYKIDHDGKYKIPLKKVSKVKGANITIYDKDGKVVYSDFTSKLKVTKKVTKDDPPKTKSTSSSSSSSSSSSGATYWGSSKSGKFHRPSCEWGQKISSSNKVVFHSRDEAINSGYVPCQVCSP